VNAIGEISAQIIVADRLAGRDRAIAKDQERLALPYAIDLSRW
jgi:hypothetical protein